MSIMALSWQTLYNSFMTWKKPSPMCSRMWWALISSTVLSSNGQVSVSMLKQWSGCVSGSWSMFL